MREVGVAELKQNPLGFLDLLEKGEEVLIMRGGEPIAKVTPTLPQPSIEGRRALEKIVELSKGVTLGGLKIKDLIEEGRR